MLCACGQLIKKRTLVDGIKSLSGVLTVYAYDGERYIKDCCFKLLIPSLYTFITKDWFLSAEILIVSNDKSATNPELLLVYQVSTQLLALIVSYATHDQNHALKIADVVIGVTTLRDRYLKNTEALNNAYQSIIRLEKDMKSIRYNYSSATYDNECLRKQLATLQVSDTESNSIQALQDTELMSNHQIRIDGSKVTGECPMCKTFGIIKKDLKRLKEESHEKISKIQYEHEIDKHKLAELYYASDKMREEILRLKEENRMLRTTNNIERCIESDDHR